MAKAQISAQSNDAKKGAATQKTTVSVETAPPEPADCHRDPRGMSLVVAYSVLILAVVSLLLSALSFAKVSQIAKVTARQDAGPADVLKKMTAHPEALRYAGMKPLAMVQVDQNNLESLAKQVSGLDVFDTGSYLVRFTNAVFLYNYAQDLVLRSIEGQPTTQASSATNGPSTQPQPAPRESEGKPAAPQKPSG
jgi:hypothetical protein